MAGDTALIQSQPHGRSRRQRSTASFSAQSRRGGSSQRYTSSDEIELNPQTQPTSQQERTTIVWDSVTSAQWQDDVARRRQLPLERRQDPIKNDLQRSQKIKCVPPVGVYINLNISPGHFSPLPADSLHLWNDRPKDMKIILLVKALLGVLPLTSLKTTTCRVTTRRTTYTAISHVWIDGLGNRQENGIPECRLRELSTFLSDMQHGNDASSLFWMDTFCIPAKAIAGSAAFKSLKSKAIQQMDSIYSKAAKVLVLDRELMSTRSGDTDTCLARVIVSAWMSRSWTLQEGLLAQECHFRFANETCSITFTLPKPFNPVRVAQRQFVWKSQSEELRRQRVRAQRPPTPRMVVENVDARVISYYDSHEVTRFTAADTAATLASKSLVQLELEQFLHTEIFGVQLSWNELHERFIYAWNALASRSTSRDEDKVIILATLLGFNRDKLLNSFQPEERLKAIVFSLDRIPLSMLFNTGPRLLQDRYSADGWVPMAMSRVTMTSSHLLRLRRRYLTFDPIPASGYPRLHAFKIKASYIVPPTADTIGAIFEGRTIWLKLRANRDDFLQFSGLHYTCLLIEKQRIGNATQLRGALLYGIKQFDGQSLTLCFFCPLDINDSREAADSTPTRTSNQEVSILRLKDVSQCQIKIVRGDLHVGQVGPRYGKFHLPRLAFRRGPQN
ncbi:hypothetical protein E8E14_000200 [Neopestalotiopsis sp. 37M]|nr:hypothetical protein E8E14_000200 [Neopestalotiopsis sp. 37M]